MKLTAKQQKFVEEYLIDLNVTQAAIRAGYSPKTAAQSGWECLRKPQVMAAVEAAKLERSERTAITADWVLKRLADEADADMADLFYEDTGDLKPVDEWPLIWRKGLVAGVEVEALYEGRGENRILIGHAKKVRLSDRIKRIELIGKHVDVQAFRDRVEHTGKDGGPIETKQTLDLSKLTEEELAAVTLLAAAAKRGGSGD